MLETKVGFSVYFSKCYKKQSEKIVIFEVKGCFAMEQLEAYWPTSSWRTVAPQVLGMQPADFATLCARG